MFGTLLLDNYWTGNYDLHDFWWTVSTDWGELTENHSGQNYADYDRHAAPGSNTSHAQRQSSSISIAAWIAAVVRACQQRKQQKEKMTRVLFSTKMSHWPPTHSLSPPLWTALFLLAFSAKVLPTDSLPVAQIQASCGELLPSSSRSRPRCRWEQREVRGVMGPEGSAGETGIRNEWEVGEIPVGAAFPKHIRAVSRGARGEPKQE